MLDWIAIMAMAAAMGDAKRPFIDATTQNAPIVFTLEGQIFDGRAGFEPRDPRSFSIALPEGNWRVELTLECRKSCPPFSVKAESRRLMVDRLPIGEGRNLTSYFIVNVRTPNLPPPPNNAPGSTTVHLKPAEITNRNWDDRLTLEFSDPAVVKQISIRPVYAPTVFLVGDSTVADQDFEPAASWGQMLPAFGLPTMAIANHAQSGETLKTFQNGYRLAKVLSQIQLGDYVFIQFGHNDQKANWPQSFAEPERVFPAYLMAYIEDVRSRGAIPVLVTSPERRNFDAEGRIVLSHGAYPDAVRRVAKDAGVPIIDLNRYSIALYEHLGPEKAAQLFNDNGADRTHHNNAGAWVLADFIAHSAGEAVPGLSKHFRQRPYEAMDALFLKSMTIMESSLRTADRPDGN